MNDDQHEHQLSQQYESIQKNLNSIINEHNMDEEKNDRQMNQSVGTIDDGSLNILDTNYSGHFLTVQVSTKLSNEESEQNDDLIMENLINASKKFIIHWMKESLVIGICHCILNVTINDICTFKT